MRLRRGAILSAGHKSLENLSSKGSGSRVFEHFEGNVRLRRLINDKRLGEGLKG